MKARSKRWIAQNGAGYKRSRRNKAGRRNDPELKAMRDAITAQKREEGHPGYLPSRRRRVLTVSTRHGIVRIVQG